jgi:hypothetical protein
MTAKKNPIVIETFRPVDYYYQCQLEQKHPSVGNDHVRVRRYRITVEEIEESPEVLGRRVQDLWDYCNNHHEWLPLRAAARNCGWTLVGTAGNKLGTK